MDQPMINNFTPQPYFYCRLFIRGLCQLGGACPFVHDIRALGVQDAGGETNSGGSGNDIPSGAVTNDRINNSTTSGFRFNPEAPEAIFSLPSQNSYSSTPRQMQMYSPFQTTHNHPNLTPGIGWNHPIFTLPYQSQHLRTFGIETDPDQIPFSAHDAAADPNYTPPPANKKKSTRQKRGVKNAERYDMDQEQQEKLASQANHTPAAACDNPGSRSDAVGVKRGRGRQVNTGEKQRDPEDAEKNTRARGSGRRQVAPVEAAHTSIDSGAQPPTSLPQKPKKQRGRGKGKDKQKAKAETSDPTETVILGSWAVETPLDVSHAGDEQDAGPATVRGGKIVTEPEPRTLVGGRAGRRRAITSTELGGNDESLIRLQGLIADLKNIKPHTSVPIDPIVIKKEEQPSPLERVLGGSMVTLFGPGLSILSISPIVTFASSIIIERLPVGTPIEAIKSLVEPFKPTISPHCIIATPRAEDLRVVVHFDDATASDSALQALSNREFEGRHLLVKPLKPSTSESQDQARIECSWFPTSAAALLRLVSKERATEIVKECRGKPGVRIRDRKVVAIEHDRLNRRGVQLPAAVRLVNLDPQTTNDEITSVFSGCTEVVRQNPKHNLTDEEILALIRSKFEITNPDDLSVVSLPDESRRRAVLSFANPSEATRIYNQLKAQTDDSFTKIEFVYALTYSATFHIPPGVWKAVEKQIREFEAQQKENVKLKEKENEGTGEGTSAPNSKGKAKSGWGVVDDKSPARMRIVVREGHAPVSLYVNGSVRSAFTGMKVAIQNILKGNVLVYDGDSDDSGKPLWDPAIRGPEGRRLVQVLAESGVHVYVDYRNCTLTLYGLPDLVAAADAFLKRQYTLLQQMQHELLCKGNLSKAAFKGGVAAVKDYLGNEMVTVDYPNRKILFRCSPSNVLHVRSLFFTFRPDTSRAVSKAESAASLAERECPVCLGPVEEPVITTNCGHAYCKSCLQSFIKATLDSRKFPISCFHTDPATAVTCSTPLAITIIQSTLSKPDVDHLFDTSFTSYIQSRPAEYSYCPTPDCTTVYKTSKPSGTSTDDIPVATSFTCTQCLLDICTSCKVPAHQGQTCAEYAAARCGEKEYQLWKRGAGVKTCPKCHIDIEKIDGCNHITCRCGAHICWHCVKDFDAGKIYDHLKVDCGGIYTDAVYNPDADVAEVVNDPGAADPVVIVPAAIGEAGDALDADWLQEQQAEYQRLEQEAAFRAAQEENERRFQRRLEAERVQREREEQDRVVAERVEVHRAKIEELWKACEGDQAGRGRRSGKTPEQGCVLM